jgi:hypothetical protein
MEAIWNANPTVNMLYCFEDGNCFIKHGEAASYAKETGAAYTVKMRNEEAFKKQVSKVIIDAVNDAQIIEENKPTKTNKK